MFTKLLSMVGVVLFYGINPDRNILASGSPEKIIKLWNLPSRQERRTLKGHTYAVNAIAFRLQPFSLYEPYGQDAFALRQIFRLLTELELQISIYFFVVSLANTKNLN